MTQEENRKVCILLVSGGLDRVVAAVNLAASAHALGKEVRLFLSWEPLLRLARGTLDDAPLPSGLADLADGVRAALAGQPGASELLAQLRQDGVKLFACSNTLHVLGIAEEELKGKVDGFSGATAFLAGCEGAQIITL